METFGTPTRRSFTVSKKLEVIEAYESRFSYNLSHTATYFDIDKSQVLRWVKNREQLIKRLVPLKKSVSTAK